MPPDTIEISLVRKSAELIPNQKTEGEELEATSCCFWRRKSKPVVATLKLSQSVLNKIKTHLWTSNQELDYQCNIFIRQTDGSYELMFKPKGQTEFDVYTIDLEATKERASRGSWGSRKGSADQPSARSIWKREPDKKMLQAKTNVFVELFPWEEPGQWKVSVNGKRIWQEGKGWIDDPAYVEPEALKVKIMGTLGDVASNSSQDDSTSYDTGSTHTSMTSFTVMGDAYQRMNILVECPSQEVSTMGGSVYGALDRRHTFASRLSAASQLSGVSGGSWQRGRSLSSGSTPELKPLSLNVNLKASSLQRPSLRSRRSPTQPGRPRSRSRSPVKSRVSRPIPQRALSAQGSPALTSLGLPRLAIWSPEVGDQSEDQEKSES